MDDLFTFKKLNPAGVTKAKLIAADFGMLLENLEEIWGTENNEVTRNISLCRTHLEQACMYAKKELASMGIYRDEASQESNFSAHSLPPP